MDRTDDRQPLRDGRHHDVIVVGGGTAGAATAMLLGRRGIRTLLVDDGAPGSLAYATDVLTRTGVFLATRWGLVDALVAAGVPRVKRTTSRYGGDRVTITVKPSYGVDALFAPRRALLQALLLAAARDAGVEICRPVVVTGLTKRGGRVSGVRAVMPGYRSIELRSELVVGADGARSTIAQHAGAAVTRTGANPLALTYAYWDDVDLDGYEWVLDPYARLGIVPTNGNRVCVFASARPVDIGAGGVDVIRRSAHAVAPQLAARLDAVSPPRRSRVWRRSQSFMRQAQGPGWALVGDAGHCKDPSSAHGSVDALRDAALLVAAVAPAIGRADDVRHALAQYEAMRDRLAVPLFDTVDRIAGHEWDRDEVADLVLRCNSAMTDELETLAALEGEMAS